MTAGDLALVMATVLCALGFTALVVALLFVFRSLTELRAAVDKLTAESEPLLAEMRRSLEEARGDLDRFDKVLGSAEAISSSVEGASRVARAAFSTPVIKTVAIASGTSRAGQEVSATMKRVFWFTAGAAAGVAGTTWAQQKVKHAAAAAKPRAMAAKAADKVRDAVREGRLGMRQKEAEMRAQLDRPDVMEVVEVQATPTRRTRRVVRVRIPRR